MTFFGETTMDTLIPLTLVTLSILANIGAIAGAAIVLDPARARSRSGDR